MVPRLHKKGKSFKGAAMYLLHDKDRATTNDRVAWTATRNLGVQDPHVAWKIQAATSMNQDRLKAAADVKNTGRKSKDHVLHLSLSWDASEAEGLTMDEMKRAANQAIHALDAGDRQALIVAHRDTDEPHVHILLNRVSPEDGRILSSSREKLKLSAWAEGYERERGRILCEERVINNERRKNRQYTRDTSHRTYHIYQLDAANDNASTLDRVRAEQLTKDAALATKQALQQDRRRQAWRDLVVRHTKALQDIANEQKRAIWDAERETAERYRPLLKELHQKQNNEREAWQADEQRFLGRMKNALRATDWRAVMRGDDRSRGIKAAFGALGSSGARLEALKRSHEAEREHLRRRELAEQRQRAGAIRQQSAITRMDAVAMFEAERQSLILTNDLEDAASRARWRDRNAARELAFERGRERGDHGVDLDAQLDRGIADFQKIQDQLDRERGHDGRAGHER